MIEAELREAILKDEIDRLKMSNVKLIAELGMIADKLGVPPSLKDVLEKIGELKPRKVYAVTNQNYPCGVFFASEAAAREAIPEFARITQADPSKCSVIPMVMIADGLAYNERDAKSNTYTIARAFDNVDQYTLWVVDQTLTDRQKELLDLK